MPQPLTDAINALTTYANTVTGASDTTLSDAVATLAAGYGGGGGGALQLIDTITVTEDTRGVNIDFTQYSAYDIIIVTEDVELTESDWLYYVQNSTTPSGGTYNDGSKLIHQGVAVWQMIVGGERTNGVATGRVAARSFEVLPVTDTVTNIFIYTYNASKFIKAGSTFKVYAGKYSEMK